MSVVRVSLPQDVADDLERRARRDGVTVDEAATTALRQFLERDPFEFVGITRSTAITGERADEALSEFEFGR